MAYQKIFKQVMSNHSSLVAWQLLASGERKITSTYLNSFYMESSILHFTLPGISLDPQLPLYFYAEDGQFIFKSTIKEMKANVLSVVLPLEIRLLEEPDVTFIKGQIGIDLSDIWRTKHIELSEDELPDYLKVKSMAERTERDQDFLNQEFAAALTLDEEDKMFADKRESPRARPKNDKWVKLKVENHDEAHLVKLFDLSRGGIGFVTMDIFKFPKGSVINILGFDQFDLDDPIIGRIMSHRPVDETMSEYKVGVKFDEGQD